MRKDRLGPLVQKPISNSRLVWFGLDRKQSSFFPRISLLRRSSFGGETARKRGKERENGEIKKSGVGDDGLPRALFPAYLKDERGLCGGEGSRVVHSRGEMY